MASDLTNHSPLTPMSTDIREVSDSGFRGEPRIWLHDVEVEVVALRGELAAIQHELSDATLVRDEERSAIVACVDALLTRAEDAASGVHPRRRKHHIWLSSDDCIEAAFRNLHRAEAEIAKLYDEDRIRAVLPEATARVDACLQHGDPRRDAVHQMAESQGVSQR